MVSWILHRGRNSIRMPVSGSSRCKVCGECVSCVFNSLFGMDKPLDERQGEQQCEYF